MPNHPIVVLARMATVTEPHKASSVVLSSRAADDMSILEAGEPEGCCADFPSRPVAVHAVGELLHEFRIHCPFCF